MSDKEHLEYINEYYKTIKNTKNSIKKQGKDLTGHFTQDDIWMLRKHNIICHQRISNYSHNHILFHMHWNNCWYTKCWWGWRATRTLIRFWWESKIVWLAWKNFCQYLIKLNLYIYPMTKQFHSLIFSQDKWKHKFTKILIQK